jgi:hypothetical protein
MHEPAGVAERIGVLSYPAPSRRRAARRYSKEPSFPATGTIPFIDIWSKHGSKCWKWLAG